MLLLLFAAQGGEPSPSEALDLLQFLDSRFAAGTAFAAAFPGGVHFDRQEPGDRTRPYVLVDLLSEVPFLHSGDGLHEPATVQFTVVADSVPEARTLRNTLTRHATEGLDFLADEDLGAGDVLLAALRTGGTATMDAEPNPDGGECITTTVDYVFILSRE